MSFSPCQLAFLSLAALSTLPGCTTTNESDSPARSDGFAVVDVSDSDRFLVVTALGPDGAAVGDVRFSIRRANANRSIPLFAALTSDGRHHVGVDRASSDFDGPLWLATSSSLLGTALIPITSDDAEVEVRFRAPTEVIVDLDAEHDQRFAAALLPLERSDESAEPERLFAPGTPLAGGGRAELSAVQPGDYELRVVQTGTQSPWTGDPVVVARQEVTIAGPTTRVAVKATPVSDVQIALPGKKEWFKLAVRPEEVPGDLPVHNDLIVRKGANRGILLRDVPAGRYSLRAASGGAAVAMVVPNDGFQFVEPTIAGQLVVPKKDGRSLAPFKPGDVLVRLGQGGANNTDFASVVALHTAMGDSSHVTVVNCGELRSFDAGDQLLRVDYVPVDAQWMDAQKQLTESD